MNDDLVQPLRGFGTHPHSDMEICTYVVNGEITHKDSMGTAESLGPGAIQFMTAGTGITHSEDNKSTSIPVRFLQIWILPRTRGLTPNYGSATAAREQRLNNFFHYTSDVKSQQKTPISVNQDVNIFVAEIEEGKSAKFRVLPNRMAYAICVEGEKAEVRLQSEIKKDDEAVILMSVHDGAHLIGAVDVEFHGPSHFLLVEMSNSPLTDVEKEMLIIP